MSTKRLFSQLCVCRVAKKRGTPSHRRALRLVRCLISCGAAPKVKSGWDTSGLISLSPERHVHPILYFVSVAAAGEYVRTCRRSMVQHPWTCLGCGHVGLRRPAKRRGLSARLVNYRVLESRLSTRVQKGENDEDTLTYEQPCLLVIFRQGKRKTQCLSDYRLFYFKSVEG